MSMELIETIELGSAQSSITFSSIPQTYTDLLIVASARTTRSSSSDFLNIELNSSASNQSCIVIQGSGSAVENYSLSTLQILDSAGGNATSNTFGNGQVYISNYTSSSAKFLSGTSVTENNGTSSDQMMAAGLWNSTAAVTSVKINNVNNANIVAGSTFSLYGITAGSDGTTTVS